MMHTNRECANHVIHVQRTENADHIENPKVVSATTEDLRELHFQKIPVQVTERKNGTANQTMNFTVTGENRLEEDLRKSLNGVAPSPWERG